MTPRLNVVLLALIVLFAVPGYWLLFDNSSPRPPAIPLHIAELRALAAQKPGKAPERVEMEVLTTRRVAQTYFAAGSGLMPVRAATMAFRLPDADGRAIVINSGPGEAGAARLNLGHFDSAAQQRVDAAVRQADKVLVTGAGPERTGGLTALADRGQIADNLWLTAAQLDAVVMAMNRSGGAPATLRTARLTGQGLQAVSPGVVVIPTPGSANDLGEMIYVRLANGTEYLFCGQLVPLSANWQRLRLHSRLAINENDYAEDDRGRDFAWLRTIQTLKREAPGLVIVPGRDATSLKGAPRFAPGSAI